MNYLLRVENLTKRFPGVLANDRLNLEILPGEIHAVLGENGAGKSTLMNVLYGLSTPDEGQIFWKGHSVSIRSPSQAIALGIGMVHQHFMQVPPLTVLENVVLGVESGLFGDMKSAEARLRKLAADFHQTINPHALVRSLSVGEQQRVEIYKAVYRNADLLILDEPTATLTPPEAERLFEVCRRLVGQRKSVIFITHKLDEVMTLSDRVTVLRHGQNVATFETQSSNRQELAHMMVGQEIALKVEKQPRQPGRVVLEIKNLLVRGDRGTQDINILELSVHQGEIVGIAGVDGNGQTELVETICGLRQASSGTIVLNGENIANTRPAHIMKKGIACLPANRHAAAIVEDFSMQENALLGFSHAEPFATNGLLHPTEILHFTQTIIDEYRVKVDSPQTRIRNLSGGHQQRFVFARTVHHDPDVLIAVQPTRGLDIVSSDFVRRKLVELRDDGKAILLVSMDLDEVMMLSDRIEVIHGGQIMGSARADSSREEIGLMMAGARRRAPAQREIS
jgi:ABC-type uncharacterized transport system ATPase subunit